MTEWQPIETAPTDGTHILAYGKVFNARDDEDEIITTVYCDGEVYYEGIGLGPRWALVAIVVWVEGDDFYPTHWMPLPKPPIMEKTDD